MGTWGSGPLDSDTAEDVLAELQQLSAAQRLAVVEHTFRSAVDGGASTLSVLPEEVIAAAAIVAANVPSGRSLAWNQEHPGITEWLPKPITSVLAASAVQALDTTLPEGGWFWRSWKDPGEKREAQTAIGRLRSVLRSIGEGEPPT